MSVYYVAPKGPSYVIGRDTGCDLILDDGYVSRKHLLFSIITHDVALLEVNGTNGATVDGIKVNKGHKLYVRSGDRIIIGTHELIWIGIRPEGKKGFMRGLAKPQYPDISPVEIEAPPQRKVPEKPSVMLAAGPALTMAIPILLGASRSVAILSSVFAAVWAAVNVLARAGRQKSDEMRRKNTYMSYLSQCEETIKSRLSSIAESMRKLYPETGEYLKEGGDPFILWNSEITAGADIKVRVGIGASDSPMDVKIPKERFAGIDDSLRALPAIIKNRYKKITCAPFLVSLSDRSVSAFLIRDTKDLETLSAFILQLAAAYSPENIRIISNLRKDTMRYYMWITRLPHFAGCDDSADQDIKSRVFITDDISFALSSASAGGKVILAAQRAGDLPSGICGIINRGKAGIRYDRIPEKLCYSYAGTMSRLWGVSLEEDRIPDRVSFGEMFIQTGTCSDVSKISDIVLGNYRSCDVRTKLAAPIGFGYGGRKMVLDLHEKASGPHGLIAGTTGSGKSELLTTLILSFAANYPPDKLAFFLVDYKGGGMSDLFSSLPHLAGSISNLSAAESKRAMTALRSENLKRQRIFAKEGVNCINDYTALYDAGAVKIALPHVLIIVDEFAELRSNEPEFMDSLISISQTGRSLGMHLILATQKPSGVVDDRIRANSRFRIALRLVDRADSSDLIGHPDAADLRECGRAYLQVGNDEIFECFQSAYAFGCANDSNKEFRIYEDPLLEKEIWPGEETESSGGDNKITWYELFINAIDHACRTGGFAKCSQMWLPPLPETVTDEKAYAIFDNPYMQKYEKAQWDSKSATHTLVIGRSGSGKSELLRTILCRESGKTSIYVIDCGGGRLGDLGKEKRCGGYVTGDDPENILRLTGFIIDEMVDRRRHMSAGCSENAILLVLDNLDEIRRSAALEVSEHISDILSTGNSVGIIVLATAHIPPDARTCSQFGTILLLGEQDPYTVSALLHVSARDVPKIRDIPGRGTALFDDLPLEFQAVKCDTSMVRPPPVMAAAKYPYVPKKPGLEDLLQRALREYKPEVIGKRYKGGIPPIPVGYEYKSGRLYLLPFDAVKCILVCGRSYSGRHTFLFNISIVAARYGISVMRADSYTALLQIQRDLSHPAIVITENIPNIIKEFYESGEGEDIENEMASFFENPMSPDRSKNNTMVLIGLMDDERGCGHFGGKIMESLTRRPYGIFFGGRPDENRILDYSFLSFSESQKNMKCHNATVSKIDEKHYFGQVIMPDQNLCG